MNAPKRYLFAALAGLIFSTAFLSSTVYAQENAVIQPRFFGALPDVPLMDGLQEAEGQLVFDKPEGRIIEVMAVGHMMPREVIEGYYRETLPQFGWVPLDRRGYARNGEYLLLSFDVAGDQTVMRMTLMPYE